jgi:hypothetical protein
MTEDDTFNRLKRQPFEDVFMKMIDIQSDMLEHNKPYDRNEYVEAFRPLGWTVEEFNKELAWRNGDT